MASAAAVGANAALSPPRNDIGEDYGGAGEVTSAIGSKENGVEGGEFVEEDEDDDIRGTAKRRGPVAAAALGDQDGQELDEEDGGGLDLFGEDEDEEPAAKPARRQLDDEELDSGDDMDRTDRVGDEVQTQEQEYETQEKVMMDLEMARQPLPEPSDGEMYLMKMPDFMAIQPQAWSHDSFQPPTTDHHSNKPPSAAFSAYNTALSTVRWRHSPSDPAKLQSNARILRWSDGSLTLQLASSPMVQYEIDGNPLAPPQRNPVKPTPVSTTAASSKGGRQGDGTVPGEKYDHAKDAFTYLVVPSESTASLRITHKITAGLSMKAQDNVQDDAIERLQAALANAANATKVNGPGDNGFLELVDEDPEERRKAAEKTMKDAVKAAKRREAAVQREADRSNRVLGRSGLGSSRYGGLSAGMLEDDELGTTTGGRRKTGATPRKSRQRRANSIYSDDEDFGRKHFTSKEDEYDEEDDFLAPSDEEEEVVDDEDEDDGIVEEPRESRRERERTPKRDRSEVAADEDADAEGEVDEEVQAAAQRTKRRRVVDEDEDEE